MRGSQLITGITVVLLMLTAANHERTRLHGLQDPTDNGADFGSYYVAAALARQGQELYSIPPELLTRQASIHMLHAWADPGTPTAIKAHELGLKKAQYFSYPPFSILLFEPFTYLEYRHALLLWRFLGLLCLVGSIYLTLRMAQAKPFLPIFGLSVLAGISFYPFIKTMEAGQISTLLLFVWVLGIYLQEKNRPVWSALTFAVGTLVKITPAVAVGVFLIRRQWNWLAAYCGWMLLLLGISVWHSGWHDNYLYFTQVFGSMSCGTPGVASKSLPSLVESVFYRNTFASQMGANVPELPSWLCLLAKATSGLLLGGILLALWKARRAAQNLSYDLVLMALASLLAAPVAWRHYYVLAILPILYFWVCLERAKPPSLMLYRCVLAAATVVIGTGQLEELIFSTQGNVLHLALSATWIAAAAGILVVALCQYRRERIAA